jgi:phosphoribosyl 1,2-cyclic phosphodiesterase
MPLELIFYGTRANISAPSSDILKYGAHTPCVLIRDGEQQIIISAGFGIGFLSDNLKKKTGAFHILLTHFHWDHIQGLNYFAPIHFPKNEVHFYSPFPVDRLKEIMDIYFDGSYGPFNGWEELNSTIHFHQLTQSPTPINEFNVSFLQVNHSDEAYAFKIQRGDSSIVYATDYEVIDNPQNIDFIEWAKGCGILIHDAMYTEEEYEGKHGWGHSSFEMACDNGAKIKPDRLLIAYHEPLRTDQELDAIEYRLKKKFHPLTVDCARQEVIYTTT